MDAPDETRVLRRTDMVGHPRRNGPSSADLPQPIPPESQRNNWINLGLGALADAVIFGCMIAGTIFLAFALYNALLDPFQYFNIVLVAAVVYLAFLVLVSIWSYFFGNEGSSGTESQSDAQSNTARNTRSNTNTNARGAQPNNNTDDRRDLIISRRQSDAAAADKFVQESIALDRISEGLERGRSVSGTGQSDFDEEISQGSDRNAQGGRKLSRTGQSQNFDQENLTADKNNQRFQEGRKLSSAGRTENSDRAGVSDDKNAQRYQEARKLSRVGQSENSDQENLTANKNAQGFQEGRKLSRTGQSENEGATTDRNAQGLETARNLSRAGQAANSDREGVTADRNSQGFQTGRSLSGPGEMYRYENDDLSNNRRTSRIETSTIYPPSKRRTRPTIPQVNEYQDGSHEDWRLEHDMEHNRQAENTGEDNTWFYSTQQRNARPYISSDFPSCIAQTLRMNAPRCTVTSMAGAGASIVQYEPQVITIPLKIRRNPDGTNQVIVSSSPTCRQPLTIAQQRTPSPARTYPRPASPTNCVRIGQSHCSSRARVLQYSQQSCPTDRNSNSQQGQNFNSEGGRRIFHQPGCPMNPNPPAENAFFNPGTDGYD